MKCCFLFPNNKIPNVDFSEIEKGNPGIGGTEFAIYTICYMLSKTFDVVLLSEVPIKGCADGILNIVIKEDFISSVNELHPDVFIAHHSPNIWRDGCLNQIDESVKIVVWVHNFLSISLLKRYSKDCRVNRVVFVGREMYDKYRDHSIVYKSSFIYNPIFISNYDFELAKKYAYKKRKNWVIYVGNIIPGKGFHILARAWKQILSEIPDAQLYVIGSGKLYNESEELGKYGIASAHYEEKFIKYLVDEHGKLLDSVHFMGILGKEKDILFLKGKVGVPNPSGISETFGYTAVEMSKLGMMITTKSVEGYLDTVPKTSGILYSNKTKLADYVIKLLRSDNKEYPKTYHYLKEHFSAEYVAEEWRKQLLEVYANKAPSIIPPSPRGRLKKIKEWKRKFNKGLGYSLFPAIDSIQQYFSIKHAKLLWMKLKSKNN